MSFPPFRGHRPPTSAQQLLSLIQVQAFGYARLAPGELTRWRITGKFVAIISTTSA
jgi:hypothetical protein